MTIKKLINKKYATSLLCITNHSIPNKNYSCTVKDGYLNFENNLKIVEDRTSKINFSDWKFIYF